MGLTILPLEIANQSDPQQTETVEFFPRPILERLGIAPVSEQDFRLASGQTIRRQTGGALFKYRDKVGVAAVIFGDEGDSTLLGAHTLESLGLAHDPIRRELVPLPMMLAFLPATTEP
ncbi:MAG TPA: hypothetical protein VLY04_07730 [Bryobacteraceae bacterium]|nr:hypothetical protein [Bryobacteraceae bacterium]